MATADSPLGDAYIERLGIYIRLYREFEIRNIAKAIIQEVALFNAIIPVDQNKVNG